MAEVIKQSSGVQELIARLRDDGVKAGQQQADKLIREAQEKAAKIVADAKAEAERLLQQARAKIQADETNAKESLRIAARDTELELESGLKKEFESHVRRLVAKEVRDEKFLEQLLAALVCSTAAKIPQEQALEVLLPESVFQTGDRDDVTEEGKERLKNFVRRATSDILREGVALLPASDLHGGIQVRLVGQDVVYDFSENALSELILKHLLPRYRAIVEGVE
jgi:V/A-type H+/Na+-transporting ATPase subunit E